MGEVLIVHLSEVIQDAPRFDILEPEWDRLYQSCGLSVFQSFEWMRTWWECFGEGRPTHELHLLVLRSEGTTVGLAPFFIETHRVSPFWDLRRLALIGSGLSDYLDLLVSPGFEREVAGLLTRYIAGLSPRVDLVHLEDLSDRSRCHAPLSEALGESRFRGRTFVHQQCPRTSLRGSWQETLAGLPPHRRKRILYQRNALPKHFAVEYERPVNSEYSEGDFNEFIEIHQAQWKSLGRQGIFAERETTRFHRKIARLFASRGWLFLTFLRLNGKRAAANYSFFAKGELCTYLNGMLPIPGASKYSPGRVLHGYTMEDGNRSGATAYDFLRGSERYKYSFNATDVPNWTILMYHPESPGSKLGFKLLMLRRSLQSRTSAELSMLRQVIQENGLFSRRTFAHLGARTMAVLRDGVRKALDPEKPVMMIVGLLRTSMEETLFEEQFVGSLISII